MVDQTPLDVLIAHQRLDISSCCCGWGELGQSFCQHQIDALNAAGFAIVKRPTGDKVTAARTAFDLAWNDGQSARAAMAAALAAAAAVSRNDDIEVPDDE